MELRQLEYFIAVCRELHFTRAADKLGISQPTLSLQIKALEHELNTPLFDRIGKKIALTEAGSLLLEQSVQVVRHLQNARDAITELHGALRGTLVVGTLPSDLDFRVSGLLIDFHREFPNVRMRVVSSAETSSLVLGNEVDIALGIVTEPDDRLERRHICQEEYAIVVSDRHEWAGRLSAELTELQGLRTVMFPRGYIGRELVEQRCRARGFGLETIMETSSVASIVQLVKANIGLTVQPRALIASMNDPQLRCIAIGGPPEDVPRRNIELLYRKDRYLGHAARMFMSRAAAHFRKDQ